jgi:hypothetical protein
MYELPTTNGKTIKLVNPVIEVCSHDKIDTGYCVSLKLVGILPGCKKRASLTISHFGSTGISISTLFEHRKHHYVEKSEMAKLINSIPVIPYIINKVEITPAIESMARLDHLNLYAI